MSFILFITVLITAVLLVVAAYAIAKALGPRSYNAVKGEPFESGIPTRGSSWIPVHIGYYLFAILFLASYIHWAATVQTGQWLDAPAIFPGFVFVIPGTLLLFAFINFYMTTKP